MRFFSVILLTLISVIMLCSCSSEKENPAKGETDPLNAAIVDFLNKKSMDMKVTEFITFDTKDDSATCTVKMQDVNGLYSIKPRWEFYFVKEAGDWVVKSYKVL